ncbi:MAG: sensor histidine kinase [Ignavibacteriales bacterium]|nr:sensor histidine kinase [Ignavibacteriales bacterium]
MELKNTRLMALFAELDPDPILRVNESGLIISVNNAVSNLINDKSLIGESIYVLLDDKSYNVKECIINNKSLQFYKTIGDKYYSIICKGISHLHFLQVYIHDITFRKKYEEELRKYHERIQEKIECERKRISYELHDGIGQNIILAKLMLQKGDEHSKNSKGNENYIKVLEVLENTIRELRKIAHNLRPRILEEEGIDSALRSLCDAVKQETGLKVEINVKLNTKKLDDKLEVLLFRITQEAINNIIKHSKADEFNIRLFNSVNIIKLIIADNGIGFKHNNFTFSSKGLGLLNMKERVEIHGGKIKIDTSPGNGTILYFDIPLN